MRVRIVNDSEHGYNTKVTSAETGEELKHVTRIDMTIEASGTPIQAALTMLYPFVDVIADAEIKRICPCCGRPVDEEGKQP